MENNQTQNPFLHNNSNEPIGMQFQSNPQPQQAYQNVPPPQGARNAIYQQHPQQDLDKPISKPPKKKSRLWLALGLAIICAGITATIAILFAMQNGSDQDGQAGQGDPKQDISALLKTYNKSTAEDNIAIPFNATSNGYYAIDFKGEGLGKKLTLKGGYLCNENIDISHYYKTQFADGSATFDTLWGYDNVEIKTGFSSVPTSSSFLDYEVLKNDGNYYLIRSRWHESGDESYQIFISNADQDYYFKIISSSMYSLEETNALYQMILNNTAIGYISFDENDDFLKSTRSIDDDTSIDISDWRFLPDMIMEYYMGEGITYIDSIHTEGFNYYHRSELLIYLPRTVGDKTTLELVTIDNTDKSSYDKIAAKSEARETEDEPVSLNAFEGAYLYEVANQADFYVNTGTNYFIIKTKLPYYKNNDNAEEQKNNAKEFMNQVFL